MKRSILGIITLLAASSIGAAQMEKRNADFYELDAFRKAAPAVGAVAPELVLSDLDGRPWALSSQRGKFVVLVKAGYT